MKSLSEYISEEGCTPCNTMGLGNPMATEPGAIPGATGEPGTEPIGVARVKKKKNKKKVSEGLLDQDINSNEALIRDWLNNVSSGVQLGDMIELDDDQNIIIPEGIFFDIDITGGIPDYIRIARAYNKALYLFSSDKGDLIIPDGFLPAKNFLKLEIQCDCKNLEIQSKKLDVGSCHIIDNSRSKVESIILPKDMKCDKLSLYSCEELKHINKIGDRIKSITLPKKFAESYIKTNLKYKGELYII